MVARVVGYDKRMLQRRQFLSFAAASTLSAVPFRRSGAAEIAFQAPGDSKPNGLQATSDGLWIVDQSEGSRVYLVSYEKGDVLRSFETKADRPSGITFDGEALWLSSTYNRLILRVDARTGSTLAEYVAPGAGPIYRMMGDPAARRSPLAPAPAPSAATNALPPGGTSGTGAHGAEWRDGKLWIAVPPSRTIFQIDPKTWIVERKFATVGNRPHGIGWEGAYLWCADSNLNSFVKHDPATGALVEKIRLRDTDPLPHGMTIWRGTMWYCDDVGVICRFKLS